MTKQITEKAADRSRMAMTQERLRRLVGGDIEREALTPKDRAEYRQVREEHQADLDMDLDPAFAPLLSALIEHVGRRRAYEAIFHPEKLLTGEVTYPLDTAEVERVLCALGATGNCDARTIERLVTDGLVPQPPQIGRGELARNAYFARHVLALAYHVLLGPQETAKI